MSEIQDAIRARLAKTSSSNKGKLSKDQIDRILLEFAQGRPIRQIAHEFKVATTTVAWHVRKAAR